MSVDHPARFGWIPLLATLVLAAFLRLAFLSDVPPGWQQDEAVNAWNARSLLQTGTDQVGESWPVFKLYALGENRTTPHVYLMLPFQLLGGMSVLTTRLPIALLGVVTVALAYFIGARLFGRRVGLTAALLLALSPWHVLLVRQGLQFGLSPFWVTAVLAAMLAAGLPLADAKARVRPLAATAAGLLAGAACYGYFAVRLFLPLMLLAALLCAPGRWLSMLRDRRERLALIGFGLGFLALFAPLALKHLSDPSMIRRGQHLLVWDESDPATTKVAKALGRYGEHFGPRFLFVEGDPMPNHSLPGRGQLPWFALPLLVAGLGAVVWRARARVAARLLLAWLVLYPVGDLIARSPGPHAPRSSPGLVALVLLSALGAVTVLEWLFRRERRLGLVALLGLSLFVAAGSISAHAELFGEYPRRTDVYHRFQADVQEACRWLRPRVDEFDAVLWTTTGMNQPYATVLAGLNYEPERWHDDEKTVDDRGLWDRYYHFGKHHFLYDEYGAWLRERLEQNGRDDRVCLILRPDEAAGLEPIHIIRRPDGVEVLRICVRVL